MSMNAQEQYALNIAYHTARVLLDSVDAGEVTASEQGEFETLVSNLVLDLAALTGNTQTLVEQYPKFFCNVVLKGESA